MQPFQEDNLFSRTGLAFFLLLHFFPFFLFLFRVFFFFLERDCLLCAICDTWLRAWSAGADYYPLLHNFRLDIIGIGLHRVIMELCSDGCRPRQLSVHRDQQAVVESFVSQLVFLSLRSPSTSTYIPCTVRARSLAPCAGCRTTA